MGREVLLFTAGVVEMVYWAVFKLICGVNYQVVSHILRLRLSGFQRIRQDEQSGECKIDQPANCALKEYTAKRDFNSTIEPRGEELKSPMSGGSIFVVQEHHARSLHYDFRLERGGVLKSWAIPKGLPELSNIKRLAVETEDHPVAYAAFEGEIPEGQYGAGKVVIWDKGVFETNVWTEKMVEVILHGKRLTGRYVLVPLKRAGEKNWLLFKAKE